MTDGSMIQQLTVLLRHQAKQAATAFGGRVGMISPK